MRLAGFITLALGLILLLGSVAYIVYAFLSAFSAAHEVDGKASSPAMSMGTALSIMSAGLIMTIVGIILLAAWNRSSRY